jgi:hypothetical protein
LLISNPEFAHNLRPVSVRARLIEERDDADDQARVNSCTDNTNDIACLYNQGGITSALYLCEVAHDPGSDQAGLVGCLQTICSSTTEAVIDCVADPSKSRDDESEEAAIIDTCTTLTSSDGITCLRVNFQACATTTNAQSNVADENYFSSCMKQSCPAVSKNVLGCVSKNYETAITDG